MMTPKADHFFEGTEAQLLEMVQTYLDKTL
jgi:hypothetical protein